MKQYIESLTRFLEEAKAKVKPSEKGRNVYAKRKKGELWREYADRPSVDYWRTLKPSGIKVGFQGKEGEGVPIAGPKDLTGMGTGSYDENNPLIKFMFKKHKSGTFIGDALRKKNFNPSIVPMLEGMEGALGGPGEMRRLIDKTKKGLLKKWGGIDNVIVNFNKGRKLSGKGGYGNANNVLDQALKDRGLGRGVTKAIAGRYGSSASTGPMAVNLFLSSMGVSGTTLESRSGKDKEFLKQGVGSPQVDEEKVLKRLTKDELTLTMEERRANVMESFAVIYAHGQASLEIVKQKQGHKKGTDGYGYFTAARISSRGLPGMDVNPAADPKLREAADQIASQAMIEGIPIKLQCRPMTGTSRGFEFPYGGGAASTHLAWKSIPNEQMLVPLENSSSTFKYEHEDLIMGLSGVRCDIVKYTPMKGAGEVWNPLLGTSLNMIDAMNSQGKGMGGSSSSGYPTLHNSSELRSVMKDQNGNTKFQKFGVKKLS